MVRKDPSRQLQALYAGPTKAHKETMLDMRNRILKVVPEAEEVISYGMPAFKVKGMIVAGIMPWKSHIGYYPFSGSVLGNFRVELLRYRVTKSAIHVPIGEPLSQSLTKKLVRARISECAVTKGERNQASYSSSDQYWRSIGLAAPARRGLIDEGFKELKDLARISEREFKKIHAIGPNAHGIITTEMRRRKIRFKP